MEKVSYSPINTSLEPKSKTTAQYAPNQVDMKDLYSEKELDDMVSKFDCLHKNMIGGNEKCEFDMVYLPTTESVIINNKNMTNDTVEIHKDGKAISVGSWHQKKLDGDYSDILKDVQTRNEANNKAKETKVTNQLDSMATLGKSQVIK